MRTVTMFETIHDVDEEAWNRLGDDSLSTHAIYRALEEAPPEGVRMRYALIRESDGEPVAAASLVDLPIDGGRLTHALFRRIIQSARTIAPEFLRSRLMICGTPLSVGNHPYRVAAGADSTSVARELAGLLRELAVESGAPWQVLKEFDCGFDDAARTLESAGWIVAPSEDDWVLPLRWDDPESWLANLRSHYRAHIQRDDESAIAAGLRCERLPLSRFEPRWHHLYEEVHDRADIVLERLESGFFGALGRALGEQGVLLRFHLEGRTVGFVVLVRHGDRLHDLFHGIDGGCNATVPLYFYQLQETIRFALENKARVLHLGQSCGRVKSRFGAEPRPLRIALRHSSLPVHRILTHGRDRLFPEPPRLSRRVFKHCEPAKEVVR